MGASKKDYFTAQQNSFATIAKALGHPARLSIIEYLMKVNTCICGDLVHQIPLAQPTISQHLKELKSAGIIQGTIEGNTICYCINKKTIHKFQNYMVKISSQLDSSQKTCC